MTKEFINPTVEKSIGTVAGTAYYVKTEREDEFGRWNDNYYTRDGYWVIHEGRQHHVYKIPPKVKGNAPEVTICARLPIIEQMRRGTLSNPYEIKESDIRRLLTSRSGDFGEVIPADVGKRVYLRHGILQMENTEQRDKRKGKGWHGEHQRHKEVATRAQAKHAQNNPMKKASSKPEWYQDAETNTYKVWKTFYNGFWATVYHVGKETNSDTEGWEYELYREKPNAEYNSLYDSSTGGDHAKDAETAMQWAINTIDEWGK